MHILVTGGLGFIGSNFIHFLNQNYPEIEITNLDAGLIGSNEKSLEEIKQYLRIHNLIKIGTDAPEDVLRQTFENAFLSGDIHNKNSENLLHNYINVK